MEVMLPRDEGKENARMSLAPYVNVSLPLASPCVIMHKKLLTMVFSVISRSCALTRIKLERMTFWADLRFFAAK
jgi:hypothetical protein